jgi:hypothetical protein
MAAATPEPASSKSLPRLGAGRPAAGVYCKPDVAARAMGSKTDRVTEGGPEGRAPETAKMLFVDST